MIYIGAKKVRILPLLHLLVFESDELLDEICKTFKLSAKCFFTVCDYKSFKAKSPQFLNSVHVKRLEASFLFTALRSYTTRDPQSLLDTSALVYHEI